MGKGEFWKLTIWSLPYPRYRCLIFLKEVRLIWEEKQCHACKQSAHRCLAILGILDRPSRLTHPGAVTHPFADVDWLSDNQVKGISEVPAVTLHASAEFSDQYWDVSDSEWANDLIVPAEEVLGSKLTSWVSHRWGFAKPLVTFGSGHHHVPELALCLAGDGFGGERVERRQSQGWKPPVQSLVDWARSGNDTRFRNSGLFKSLSSSRFVPFKATSCQVQLQSMQRRHVFPMGSIAGWCKDDKR